MAWFEHSEEDPVLRLRLEEEDHGYLEIISSEKRNFVVLSLSHVLHRIGHVFKLEALVIPSLVRALGSTNAQLGWIRMGGRFVQMLPTLYVGSLLRRKSKRKGVLITGLALVGMIWLTIGVVFSLPRGLLPSFCLMPLFLLLYLFGWVATSVVNVARPSLEGKLVRPELRGRMLGTANLIGGVLAGAVMVLLIRPVVAGEFGLSEMQRYGVLFVLSGGVFFVAAAGATWLRDPAIEPRTGGARPESFVGEGLRHLKNDGNLRKIVAVSCISAIGSAALPFYVSYGRDAIGLDSWAKWFGIFGLAQIGLGGVATFAAGFLADRLGNRLALRILIPCTAFTPLAAVVLARLSRVWGAYAYGGVFLFIGLLIAAHTIIRNYTLELCDRDRQPLYVAVLNLTRDSMLCLAPLIGFFLDHFNVERMFCVLTGVMLLNVPLLVLLEEPREKKAVGGSRPGRNGK